ncbi:MAG: ABC transporter substrate binding protein [Desulfuromonadaceae bacterium]|nr:ABC transporter substrate binding protein [Desulfuromonadaceae bacterium]
MRALLIYIILAMATLLPTIAQAYDVLVLQSRRDTGYEEALKGFRAGNSASYRLMVLSDYSYLDVSRIVREDRPRLILALGDAALKEACKVQHIPVVALMALGIHDKKSSRSNLTGIGMFVSPERYISIFKSMKARRVGLIYDPAKSGWYLRLAQNAAQAAGITLVTREVSRSSETLAQISSLADKVDALWMIPDTTAITRETTEAYFRFGQDLGVPVVSFAATYLELGAAAVLEIDRIGLGRQANALISAIFEDDPIGSRPLAFPKNIMPKGNPVVLKRLRQSVE